MNLPPAAIAVVVAAIVAGVFGLVTQIINARARRRETAQSNETTRYLGVIRESQASQSAALATANAQLARQDEQIKSLERQARDAAAAASKKIADLERKIDAMRAQLEQALRSHLECEDARNAQGEIIVELRKRLGEPQ